MESWRFSRAVIRVAANIPYEHAQAAIDGDRPHDLTESALRPLWACWAALKKARAKREPLDLDLPERRVVLDEDGRIQSVAPRERLDAHRLIEDYMIAANVAAAKAPLVVILIIPPSVLARPAVLMVTAPVESNAVEATVNLLAVKL